MTDQHKPPGFSPASALRFQKTNRVRKATAVPFVILKPIQKTEISRLKSPFSKKPFRFNKTNLQPTLQKSPFPPFEPIRFQKNENRFSTQPFNGFVFFNLS